MERLTIEYDGHYVPKELCTIDRLGGADDCAPCHEDCDKDCSKCAVQKCFDKLAEYENLEEQRDTEPSDMDKLTTEMMEHICDNICKHPGNAKNQDELNDICAECKMGKFVCDILNTYNHQTKQLEELKETALDPIEMCKVKIALDKLKKYEERGILPPCNVGDTIYVIGVLGDFENAEECRVVNIHYHTSDIQTVFRCDAICKKFNMGYSVQVKFEDFGKTVFLTEQEAQSAVEKIVQFSKLGVEFLKAEKQLQEASEKIKELVEEKGEDNPYGLSHVSTSTLKAELRRRKRW